VPDRRGDTDGPCLCGPRSRWLSMTSRSNEVVVRFLDRAESVPKGIASVDYQNDYAATGRTFSLKCSDVMASLWTALVEMVHRETGAEAPGRASARSSRKLIPRQCSDPIQAAIRRSRIARGETLSACAKT